MASVSAARGLPIRLPASRVNAARLCTRAHFACTRAAPSARRHATPTSIQGYRARAAGACRRAAPAVRQPPRNPNRGYKRCKAKTRLAPHAQASFFRGRQGQALRALRGLDGTGAASGSAQRLCKKSHNSTTMTALLESKNTRRRLRRRAHEEKRLACARVRGRKCASRESSFFYIIASGRNGPQSHACASLAPAIEKPHVGAKKLKRSNTEPTDPLETRTPPAFAGHRATTLHRTRCVWQCTRQQYRRQYAATTRIARDAGIGRRQLCGERRGAR